MKKDGIIEQDIKSIDHLSLNKNLNSLNSSGKTESTERNTNCKSTQGMQDSTLSLFPKFKQKNKKCEKQLKFQDPIVNNNSIFSQTVNSSLNNNNSTMYGDKSQRQKILKSITDEDKRIFNETMNQIVVQEIFQTKEFKARFNTSDFNQDKKIQEELMGTPGTIFDIQDKDCHGNTAFAYFNTLKNLEKIQQKYELLQQMPNSKTKMLQNQIYHNQLPKTLGVFPKNCFGEASKSLTRNLSLDINNNNNGNNNGNIQVDLDDKQMHNLNLNVSHYSLNKVEAKSFSNGLQHYKHLQKKHRNTHSLVNEVSIQGNNFEQDITEKIVKNIPQNSKIINLRQNKISDRVCEMLNDTFIGQSQSKLKEIYLDRCGLNDKGFSILMQNSDQQYRLKVLSVCGNQLGDGCSEDLYEMAKFNGSLEEFYCNWNNLKGEACHNIFQGLINNTTLKVLDLSSNQLGGDSHPQAAKSVGEALLNSEIRLIHLDLSKNKFSENECQTISLAFNQSQNENMLGLHFNGNSGYVVDPLGFLHKPENFSKTYNTQHKIDGLKISGIIYKGEDLMKVDNCWICEGWQQTTFVHRYADYENQDNLYIHLDFLQYKPVKMTPRQHSIYFYTTMMVPPKRDIYYFYTIPKRNLQEINDEQHVSISCSDTIPQKFTYEDGSVMEKQNLKYVNCFKSRQCKVIDDNYGIKLVTSNMRRLEKELVSEINIQYEKKESIITHEAGITSMGTLEFSKCSIKDYRMLYNSIFSDLKLEIGDELQQLIYEDFKEIQLQKIITDETDLKNTKLILTSNYQKLIDIFFYYSSKSPMRETFTISLEQYSNFLAVGGIADNFLKVSDADLIYQYVKARHFKWKLGLTRYMFIEVLIRIVQTKYIQNGLESKFFEGLKHLLQSRQMNDLMKRIQHPLKWREKWISEPNMEKVIIKYWPVFKGLFDHYSVQKNIDGKINQKIMTLSDFHNFIDELDEGDLYIPEEDIFLAFHYSSITESNDILGLKPHYLGILEFIEAITRLSEDYYMNPQQYKQDMSFSQQLKMNKNKSGFNLSLASKLEGFIYYVYKHSTVLTEIIQDNHSYISVYYNMFQRKGVARKSLMNIVEESFEKVSKRQDDDNRANKYQALHQSGTVQGAFPRQFKKRSMIKTNFNNSNEGLLKKIIESNMLQSRKVKSNQASMIKVRKRQNTQSKNLKDLSKAGSNQMEESKGARERMGSSSKTGNTSGNLNLFFEHSSNNKIREKELNFQKRVKQQSVGKSKRRISKQFNEMDHVEGDEEFDIPDISSSQTSNSNSDEEDDSFSYSDNEKQVNGKKKLQKKLSLDHQLRDNMSVSSESSVEFKGRTEFQIK